jgi:RNA polymerase sigma factor for flagellar operon FliA
MKPEEVKELWVEYFASKANGAACPKTQRKLVENYYPLVRVVAQRMHQKLNEVTVDELSSMGVDGLYDAVDGYDPEKFTNKFETYAMHRIRGSMLDGIRKADWVPRLVRSNSTWLEKQRSIHESAAGHRLKSDELWERIVEANREEAESRGITGISDFEEYVESSTTPAMHSVNDIQSENDNDKGLGIEHIKDNRASQPIERMLRRELFDKLMGKNFTKQERKIIWLYYFEDLSMKEISDIVKLSESRVSQMHGDIRARLQQKAARNPDYFSDIWSMMSQFKEAATAA